MEQRLRKSRLEEEQVLRLVVADTVHAAFDEVDVSYLIFSTLHDISL